MPRTSGEGFGFIIIGKSLIIIVGCGISSYEESRVYKISQSSLRALGHDASFKTALSIEDCFPPFILIPSFVGFFLSTLLETGSFFAQNDGVSAQLHLSIIPQSQESGSVRVGGCPCLLVLSCRLPLSMVYIGGGYHY